MFRVRRHKSRKTLRLCVTWRLLHHHLPEQIAPGVSVREQGLFQHKTRGLQDAGCWHLVVYGSLFVHSSLITAHSCPPSPLPPAPPPKKPTPQTPSPPPHTRRWVFKQLFEKGLVYRGFKVMPFSTACSTPLSNFEAGLNYKDVDDPAVMVRSHFLFRGAGGASHTFRGRVAHCAEGGVGDRG